jgi:hypothetical protein
MPKLSKTARPDAIAMLAALSTPEPQAPAAPLVAASPIRPPRTRKPKPGARAGTRLIAGHFPEATLKALKHLLAEEDTTLQALLDEAIHDLLVKKGMTKLLDA